MKTLLFTLLISLSPVALMAESKLSVDLSVDNLQFQKPPKGVGRAGILNFKSANVNNNGIILNINNVNNFFNSQIFIRPTFLGFTTQFGNYGFALEESSLFNSIDTIELANSKLILDDNQINLAGEYLKFVNPDLDIKLNQFRLYCQSPINTAVTETPPPTDMVKICTSYLTLNGTYKNDTDNALLVYRGVNKLTGDKTDVEAKVKSIDIRKDQLQVNLVSVKSISNDSYVISATDVNLKCAKDPALTEVNTDKITKDCLNSLKLSPLKLNLADKKTKTNFNIDLKDITVKDKIIYATLNSASLSDPKSTTFLSGILLNCKKETDTDLMEITQVLRDCISYGRVSINEVKSTKSDEGKASYIKKIALSSASSALIVQADIKFLGFTSRVSIHGNLSLDETKKQVTLNVTDTRLPLGLTSVKLLMYFLKKNFISKDIAYVNNNIIISL